MTMSGIHPWYINGREEHMPSGSTPQPIPIRSTVRARWTPIASPSSSTASDTYSDNQSVFSSPSTAPSSVPSRNPPAAMNPITYDFPCEFEFVNCHLSFHPAQIDAWISHSLSHFLKHLPPPKTCCTFCDQVFENSNDPVLSWRQRMCHIAGHFRNLDRQDDMRPDFFVIEYMWKKRILSVEDYQWAIRHTERPECDGLVDFGYKPPEIKRREDRRSGQRYDLDKENRQRRRERDSRGKGKGKGNK